MSASLAQRKDAVDRDKRTLRRRARRIRADIPSRVAARAAQAAARHALSLTELADARLVGLYAALPGELDTEPLASALAARGIAIAFPRVVPGQRRLSFCRAEVTELAPGTFGIREPGSACPLIVLGDIDTFVVPGVAFDRHGQRLGWGRGHYDTTLAAAPRAARIGYCFSDQRIDHVPTEPRDQAMDWIVTEDGAYRCQRAGGR